jgi:RNA polymerase sigma-70 factor (ECF subfamily)
MELFSRKKAETPEQKSEERLAEQRLIERILAGQQDLFMDLIRPHERTVYATALTLTGSTDDAEDIVQAAMLKALSKVRQFRGESAFGTWLIQITINEVRMRKRKERRVEMMSLTRRDDDEREASAVPEDFEDWREIPSESLERSEVREALMKALNSLELHYREAFLLRDIHELSITETARILGISRGAVKTRLHRARLRLREILSQDYGSDGWFGWTVREVRRPWT